MPRYHVALALTPEQVKRLRLVAITRDLSVQDYVTEVVIKSLDGPSDRGAKEKEDNARSFVKAQ